MLDLTDAKDRAKIGFSLKELVGEDWEVIQASGKESWTQAIGRGCLTAGFEAILVPSARNNKGKELDHITRDLESQPKHRDALRLCYKQKVVDRLYGK